MSSSWALSSSRDWSLHEFWAVRTDRTLTEADKARGLVQTITGRSAVDIADKRDEQDRIEEGTA